MTPVAGLVFDMDGLLVDSEPLARQAMTRFLARYGREVDPAIQRQLLGRRLPDAIAIVRDGYGLEPPVEQLTEEYGALRLAAIRGNLRTMPGAVDLIEWGRAQGLRLGLATSALRPHADVSLGEVGLAGRFDAEATGSEVSRGKPAPDLFLLAAERIGCDPSACVVFEDAPNGVAAAAAAGMRSVYVPNDQSRDHALTVQPTVTLGSLEEAISWLQGEGLAPMPDAL